MLRILPALLFAVVLAGGCASPGRLARQHAVIDSLQAVNAAYRAERNALEDSLAFYAGVRSGQYARDMEALRDRLHRLTYQLAVCRDGATMVATLAADDLFAPASAALTDRGRARLLALAGTLGARFPDRTFRIEGHADNLPPGPSLRTRYPSNWELAAARAAAVVRFLAEQEGLASARFEVVALGDTQPVATNETPQGRRQNRRIRVAVLPQ